MNKLEKCERNVCETCGGSGSIQITIVVPECCGDFLWDSSCCGKAVPAEALEQDVCPDCYGYGAREHVLDGGEC